MALFLLLVIRPNPFFDPNKPPKIITANFVDIDRIYMISKYRSGAGHDYTLNGETCRSMKHYFNIGNNYDPITHIPLRSQPTATDPNINIYSPFDGWIGDIGNENTPIGKQIHVIAAHNPLFAARIFHVDLLPSLRVGSYVKSGQLIATIGPRDGTDFALETNKAGIGGYGVSMFEAMTNQAFKPYADKGYKRQDFIISRADRDAHPLDCTHDDGDRFKYPAGYNHEQDYVRLGPNPYAESSTAY